MVLVLNPTKACSRFDPKQVPFCYRQVASQCLPQLALGTKLRSDIVSCACHQANQCGIGCQSGGTLCSFQDSRKVAQGYFASRGLHGHRVVYMRGLEHFGNNRVPPRDACYRALVKTCFVSQNTLKTAILTNGVQKLSTIHSIAQTTQM
jgi:hypothetical protein